MTGKKWKAVVATAIASLALATSTDQVAMAGAGFNALSGAMKSAAGGAMSRASSGGKSAVSGFASKASSSQVRSSVKSAGGSFSNSAKKLQSSGGNFSKSVSGALGSVKQSSTVNKLKTGNITSSLSNKAQGFSNSLSNGNLSSSLSNKAAGVSSKLQTGNISSTLQTSNISGKLSEKAQSFKSLSNSNINLSNKMADVSNKLQTGNISSKLSTKAQEFKQLSNSNIGMSNKLADVRDSALLHKQNLKNKLLGTTNAATPNPNDALATNNADVLGQKRTLGLDLGGIDAQVKAQQEAIDKALAEEAKKQTPPATPPGAPPATPPGAPPATPPGTPPATPPGTPPATPPATPPGTPPATPPGTPPATPPGTPPGAPPVTPPVTGPQDFWTTVGAVLPQVIANQGFGQPQFIGGGGGGSVQTVYVSEPAYATQAPPQAAPEEESPAEVVELIRGIDLELVDVRMLDAGKTNEQGPRYRVSFRNNGSTAIDQPFNITMMAATEMQVEEGLPQTLVRIGSIPTGQTKFVDVRLPATVFNMNGETEGRPTQFSKLLVFIDRDEEISDVNRDNNLAGLDKSDILRAK